uniref:Malate dehydrogenase n=2 Tax=Culex pipiens TaxID=7175 RepID=A0A8D8NXF7_CULPI
MVTIACDTLPKAGFLEPKCAFGISMLYIVRPNTFIGEGVDFGGSTFPVNIPVIGGHSGQTIIPVSFPRTRLPPWRYAFRRSSRPRPVPVRTLSRRPTPKPVLPLLWPMP